jgi:hypothetical protein
MQAYDRVQIGQNLHWGDPQIHSMIKSNSASYKVVHIIKQIPYERNYTNIT